MLSACRPFRLKFAVRVGEGLLMERQNTRKPEAHQPAKPSSAGSQAGSTFEGNLTSQQQTVMAMQRLIGNHAVQRLVDGAGASGQLVLPQQSIQRWTQAEVLEHVPNAPDWAGDEDHVRAIQRQLRRLGLYHLGIDGDYGAGSDSALVEAFGGDDFRTMDVEAALQRLRDAAPPEGTRGQHNLRYGEMFRDSVLDMTIGLGYDEALESNPTQALDNFRAVLEARGFTNDDDAATDIYQQAGRAMQPSVGDLYFVRRDALIYTPPAGEPRSIHAVVRLVSNTGGDHGAEAAQAFREGMVESDMSYYSGHGRYGTGPDFDRNFASFVLHDLDDPTQTEPPILDYDVLEEQLRHESRQRHLGRSAWQQFLWRQEHGLIDVTFSNAGNVRINTRNLHAGEFGSNLINWALNEGHIQAATGAGGDLATEAAAQPDRRYRVVVFDGCRTSDYETSLRSTPGFGRGSTQTIETTRTVFGDDDAATLGAFLDSILHQQSAEQIIHGMDNVQDTIRSEDHVSPRGTFVSHGTSTDPTIR
jgi:hypothetical protein